MTISPTGYISEALMYPKFLGAVMALIKEMPAEGDFKRELLMGWARTVGVRVSPSQLHSVFVTGSDQFVPQGGA